MQLVALLQRSVQRNQYHGHDHNGQNGMGQQNGEINGTEPGGIAEYGRAAVQIISQISVVGEVANQEQGRSCERGDHAVAVRALILAPDEIITPTEEYRA